MRKEKKIARRAAFRTKRMKVEVVGTRAQEMDVLAAGLDELFDEIDARHDAERKALNKEFLLRYAITTE